MSINPRNPMSVNESFPNINKQKLYKTGVFLASIGLFTWWCKTGIHNVRQNQRGLVEVFGKYVGTVNPGLRFTYPFPIGRMIKMPIDLRRSDIPHQWVITKEQLNAQVDAVAYYQITDPFKVSNQTN